MLVSKFFASYIVIIELVMVSAVNFFNPSSEIVKYGEWDTWFMVEMIGAK